jgi:hypothetical protein
MELIEAYFVLSFHLSGASEENHELIMKFLEGVTPVGVCHIIVIIIIVPVPVFMNTFHCGLNTIVICLFFP